MSFRWICIVLKDGIPFWVPNIKLNKKVLSYAALIGMYGGTLISLLTWCAAVVEVVVAAAADGMLEYTLDVVKLEPGDRKRSDETATERI